MGGAPPTGPSGPPGAPSDEETGPSGPPGAPPAEAPAADAPEATAPATDEGTYEPAENGYFFRKMPDGSYDQTVYVQNDDGSYVPHEG